jgi:hypothetical protein
MILSAYAKRLAASLKAAGGAALMEFNAGTNYAAGTIGAAVRQLFAGPTLTGPLTLSGSGTDALHAVTKQQMDAADLATLNAADAAADAALLLAVRDRVDFGAGLIVKGQTSAGAANYVYRMGQGQRIGSTFVFNLMVSWSGHTGTGFMSLEGLPFVPHLQNVALIARVGDGTVYRLLATRGISNGADAAKLYFLDGDTPVGVTASGVLQICGSYPINTAL